MMKETLASTFDALKEQFGYTSKMQAPRITKVVVSMGVGKISDKNRLTFIRGRLATITGQKVADRIGSDCIPDVAALRPRSV